MYRLSFPEGLRVDNDLFKALMTFWLLQQILTLQASGRLVLDVSDGLL